VKREETVRRGGEEMQQGGNSEERISERRQ